MHLGRRLGAGRELELDLDAVDDVGLAGLADLQRGHDQPHLTGGGGLSEAAAHLPGRPAVERGAVHVTGPAGHRGAGVDVLLHGVFGEVLGRDDHHLAGVDGGLAGHPQHAAEVVDVGVGVDHGPDRPVAAVRAVQPQRGRGGFGADQRVDDDDAGVALDEGDVGQVQAAYLVDAGSRPGRSARPGHHLVEALFGAQPALPPQARVHGGRCVAGQERAGVVVPHHSPVGGGHHPGPQGGDEAPVGVGEIGGVVERQGGQVGGLDRRAGRGVLHSATVVTVAADAG
mgnify:CR=1 FL=1